MFKVLISHSLGELAVKTLFDKLAANMAVPHLKPFKVGDRFSRIIRRRRPLTGNHCIYYNAVIEYMDSHVFAIKYEYRINVLDTTTREGNFGKFLHSALGNYEIIEESNNITTMKSLKNPDMIVEWMHILDFEFIK
jgi:hypothetical protein